MRCPMEQHSGLRRYQEQIKDETRARIDEAIQSMRAERITITVTSLAEETGLSRRTLYADYVQSYLKNFREFNPAISDEPNPERITELENNLKACKDALKKREKDNRELKLENAVLKQRLHEADERYEHLLGQYQVDVGNKIIHF